MHESYLSCHAIEAIMNALENIITTQFILTYSNLLDETGDTERYLNEVEFLVCILLDKRWIGILAYYVV